MSPKQKTKQKIIAAAMQEFSKHGFSKTSIQNIANTAGLGKGTVYEYFTSKDELFNMCFISYLNSMMGDVEQQINPDVHPIQTLKQIFTIFFKEFENHKDFFVIYLEYMLMQSTWMSQGKPPELIENIYSGITGMISQILSNPKFNLKFKKGVVLKDISVIITGLLDALMLYKMINPAMVDIKSSVETIINMINNSLEQEYEYEQE